MRYQRDIQMRPKYLYKTDHQYRGTDLS
jgi:hypothetical protein